MKESSPTKVWFIGLASEFIEGACDAFLIAAGGSTAGQMLNAEIPSMTPQQLGLSVLLGGTIYLASQLKKHPLPTVSNEPTPVITPPILPAP